MVSHETARNLLAGSITLTGLWILVFFLSLSGFLSMPIEIVQIITILAGILNIVTGITLFLARES